MNQARRTPVSHSTVSAIPVSAAAGANAATLDELSRQLNSWSHLWPGSPDSAESADAHHLVRERLTSWLERCIGRRVRSLLVSNSGSVSLATSTPLLTAFLGRRATRELSRQVLRDL